MKPSNNLIDDSGTIIIADLGSAILLEKWTGVRNWRHHQIKKNHPSSYLAAEIMISQWICGLLPVFTRNIFRGLRFFWVRINWVDFENCGKSGNALWNELKNVCEFAGFWENLVWGSREEKGGRGVG